MASFGAELALSAGTALTSTPDYYRTPAQLDLRDLRGRDGFRIRVESDGESFFVGADQVEVINC